MFEITSTPLNEYIQTKDFTHTSVGAKVTFEGIIRDYNEGQDVESLEFEVYDKLAQSEGEKIILEAKEKYNLFDVYCVHRIGHLQITDIAVIVVATAGHRDIAFDGCRYVIDELKKRVRIWKKEHYKGQKAEWLKGHVPEV